MLNPIVVMIIEMTIDRSYILIFNINLISSERKLKSLKAKNETFDVHL